MAARILQDLSAAQQVPVTLSQVGAAPLLEPKDAVLKSRDLFLAYGDALIASKKWNEFATLLARPSLPVERVDVELMQAICDRGLSLPGKTVEGHLTTALSLARNTRNPSELSRVAETAEKLGVPAIALETLELLSMDRRSRLESLKRIFRLQLESSDPEGRLRTAEAILEIRPGLAPYADEISYLSLLTGKGIEQTLQRVATSSDGAGTMAAPLRKLTSALAAYLCGDTGLVRRNIEGLVPGMLAAGPRAVLAGLLAETGREIEALRIVEKIHSAALTPDEFWFYRMALR